MNGRPPGWILTPVAVGRVWGAGPPTSSGYPVGEWWLLSDLAPCRTLVETGPDHGLTVSQLATRYGRQFWGLLPPAARFPVLIKQLLSRWPLPLQVHPIDQERKHEVWYIQGCQADSWLTLGWRTTRERLVRDLAQGALYPDLAIWPARAGWGYVVPGGVPHALGPGIRAIEIQDSADVTIRIHCWGMQWPELHCEPVRAAEELARTPWIPSIWAPPVPVLRLGGWGMAVWEGRMTVQALRPLVIMPADLGPWQAHWGQTGRLWRLAERRVLLVAPGSVVAPESCSADARWLLCWPLSQEESPAHDEVAAEGRSSTIGRGQGSLNQESRDAAARPWQTKPLEGVLEWI